jgi:hypothetical protein
MNDAPTADDVLALLLAATLVEEDCYTELTEDLIEWNAPDCTRHHLLMLALRWNRHRRQYYSGGR